MYESATKNRKIKWMKGKDNEKSCKYPKKASQWMQEKGENILADDHKYRIAHSKRYFHLGRKGRDSRYSTSALLTLGSWLCHLTDYNYKLWFHLEVTALFIHSRNYIAPLQKELLLCYNI